MYEGKGAFELKEDKKAAPKQVKVENVSRSSVQRTSSQAKQVSMIAGGTGITPMLQLVSLADIKKGEEEEGVEKTENIAMIPSPSSLRSDTLPNRLENPFAFLLFPRLYSENVVPSNSFIF